MTMWWEWFVIGLCLGVGLGIVVAGLLADGRRGEQISLDWDRLSRYVEERKGMTQ